MKLFVDNLTNVDFSYLDPKRGLLGESWLVELELDGSLNEQGMICDFGIVKKRVKDWFDAGIDHALVVPTEMPDLSVTTSSGYRQVSWLYQGQACSCRSPEQAIVPVPLTSVTPEGMAKWCEAELLALFPDEVKGLSLRFVPEAIDGAYYHYSHGLQQHDGNCQRIAHGHRSRLKLYLDGRRHPALEKAWAQTFCDIYIGTRAHLVGDESAPVWTFRYQAPQGDFEICLPRSVCYLIETESTVEQIAMHLADEVKKAHPNQVVKVRAYEGMAKGAIAER
ncbi:MAG: 6-carboxytetrahydropterin synthase [Pontibacterium sp.]